MPRWRGWDTVPALRSAPNLDRGVCAAARRRGVAGYGRGASALTVGLWGLVWCVSSFAGAQSFSDGAGTARSEPAPAVAADLPAAPAVREMGPKLYYLRDKDGNLVPVPDIPFERYEQFLAQEIGGGGLRPPLYGFADLVELRGKAAADHAELDAVFPLRFTLSETAEAPWVRVPLRLNQGIPTGPPKLAGGGEVLLEYATGDGYVAWIRPATAATSLVLKLKFPIARANGHSRLVISAVRTPTRLELEVPSASIEGRALHSEEQMLSVSRPGENRTVLVVDGTGGELGLSWGETNESPSMLEATGTVLMAVNGGRIQCDARLKVHSYGAPIDSFVVRLPPEMELNAFNPPGFRLSVVSTAEESLSGGQRILVKRLDGKTTDPLEVRLVAWRPPQLGPPRAPLELGGFEVLDAVRQWGTFDVAADGEWQCDFLAGTNVQRVEVLSDASRQQNLVARFEYFRQPYSLKLELVPKQSRLKVEPVFLYRVEPQRVHLEARLRYKATGARPSDVKIDFGGWIVDRVTPAEFLAEPVLLDSLTPLRVPLAGQSLGAAGEFELRVEAHRELTDQKLVLGPIRCPETATAPALVIVVAAENTEVIPESNALVDLIPDRLPPWLTLDVAQQAPLVYREEPTTEGSVFVGAVRQREQAVQVQVDTRVTVEQGRLVVEQTCAYQVSYEPLRELVFELPASGPGVEDLEIVVESQTAAWTRDEQLDPRGGAAARLRTPLPKPCLGRCEAILRYTVPVAGMQFHAYRSLELPLLQPVNEDGSLIIRNSLRLAAADNVVADLQDEQWTLATSAETASGAHSGSTPQFAADGRRSTATLSAALIPRNARQAITLHRAWLQVWLANDERRDRAVFQLTTDQDQLEVQLPLHAHARGERGVRIWLSGREHADFTVRDDQRVRIELGKNPGLQRVTVELFYWFTIVDPPIGRLTVEPPAVLGATRAPRFYWQLVLPRSEYLCWSPDSLIREGAWRWQGLFFGRETNLNQSELEDWLQASRQQVLPQATNQYLYSSLGSVTPRVFFSAKRHVLVLGFSGAVLAVSCLLIYVPRLRHPALLVAGAVALAAFGAIYSEPAVLAAQAASVGIALVPVARLLEWTASNRRVRRMAVRATAYGRPDSQVAEHPARRGENSSQTGTATHFRTPAAEPQL